jgi:hypothetical protein
MYRKKPNFWRNSSNADAVVCNGADDSRYVGAVAVFEVNIVGAFAFDKREKCATDFQIVCEVWVRPAATVNNCNSHSSALRILPNLWSANSGKPPLLSGEWISW